MGTSSAVPAHLEQYVAASRSLHEHLARRLGELVETYDRVVPRLRWGTFDATGPVGSLATHLRLNEVDDAWVAAIAARFREAGGGGGGVATVDDASVDAALRAAGVPAGPRADLTVDDPIMAGAPPTSGYADDPVCTATGHFVEHEVDLPVPGRSAMAGWARTYSSRWGRPGPFGRGWASWASVRVEPVTDGAVVVLPDGRRAPFPLARVGPGARGASPGAGERAAPGGVARASEDLAPPAVYGRVGGLPAELLGLGADGWELRWFDQARWRFDRQGRPVRVTAAGAAGASLYWDGGRLRGVRATSGRWVALDWDVARGRVIRVRAGDGRVVRYRYDEQGDLLEVVAPGGAGRRYELADGLVVAVIDADGLEVVRNAYDPDGRVRWQRSPFGRRTTYAYPGRGVTVVRDDEGGPATTFVHDEAGRLVGVVDDHGARMTKVYDPWGNPVAVADRTGAVVVQEWDDRARLLRRIEPGGATTTWSWDDQDRIVARTDACGATVRLAYDGDAREPCRVVDGCGSVTELDVVDGLVAAVTDPDGVTTRFERDADGLVVAVVDAFGGRHTFAHDPAGHLVEESAPTGAALRYERDGAGRVVRRVEPDGAAVGFEWTAAGRLAACTSAAGARSEFRSGAHGEVVEVQDAAGATTALRWDTSGQLVEVEGPLGARVRHRYDGLGRLVSTVDATGAELRREHDAEGRVVALVNGEGEIERREYDGCGRLVAVLDGAGRATRFEHDPCGRVVAVVDADGGRTTQRFDAAGRVVEVVDPSGGSTRLRWSPGGRLRSVTTADGRVLLHRYDEAGRLSATLGPGDAVQRYERDAAGRLIAVVDGSGARTSVLLDPCGRVVARTDACGDTTRWAYHPSGRVASVVAPGGGTSRFGWDPAGRLVSATDPNGGETTWRWTAAGALAGAVDPLGGRQVVRCDAMDRMVGWDDQVGRRTDLYVDRAGRPAGHRDPSGCTVRVERDASGHAVALLAEPSGQRFIFEPDAGSGAGDRSAPSAPGAATDAGGRSADPELTATVLSAGSDPDGRSAHSEPATGELSAGSDAGGRSAHAEPLEVDALGRPVVLADGTRLTWRHGKVVATDGPAGRWDFAYDPAGQLVRAETADGRAWTWAYDAAGRPTTRTTPTATERFTHDPTGRLTEVVHHGPTSAVTLLRYDAAGRRVREIRGEPGRLASTRYQWDGLGRLTAVHRKTGAERERTTRLQLDRRGDLIATDGELGDLVPLDHRTLDRATGSFLSPDPLPGVPGAAVLAHPYHHADNDPLALLDPLGLRPMSDADLAAFREAAVRTVLGKAYDSTRDLVDDPMGWAADHWETVAAAGLLVVGTVLVATGVGAPIGIGIFVGAGASFGTQVGLTGEVDQRSLMVSAAAGGIGGGAGAVTKGLATTAHVVAGAGTDAALSAGSQYVMTGRVDVRQVVVDSAIGGGTTRLGSAEAFRSGVKVDPGTIRYSQNSINDTKGVLEKMAFWGWEGPPIDVVKMPDGAITALDNTRLRLADHHDIKALARFHRYDDAIDPVRAAHLRVPKGHEAARTWGEAIDHRISLQAKLFRERYPAGSPFTGWSGP